MGTITKRCEENAIFLDAANCLALRPVVSNLRDNSSEMDHL